MSTKMGDRTKARVGAKTRTAPKPPERIATRANAQPRERARTPQGPVARTGSKPPEAPKTREIVFNLTGQYIALDNLLKITGLAASGGAAKALAAAGAVRVNRVVELRKTCKIRAGQVVDIAGARIRVLAAVE